MVQFTLHYRFADLICFRVCCGSNYRIMADANNNPAGILRLNNEIKKWYNVKHNSTLYHFVLVCNLYSGNRKTRIGFDR